MMDAQVLDDRNEVVIGDIGWEGTWGRLKCRYWSKFPIIRGPIFGFPLKYYINFPHFGNSNLGKLPCVFCRLLIPLVAMSVL